MISLTINKRAISWNVFYSGRHWSVRSKMKTEWTTEVGQLLKKLNVDKDLIRLPLRIEIDAYAKRPIDPDNNASGKFIIDAIKQEFGIDDSCAEIRSVTYASHKAKEDYIILRIYDGDDT